ncbi:MAG: nuclear transport factor 2 family protein [Pyrinomonadaceae bacterium]
MKQYSFSLVLLFLSFVAVAGQSSKDAAELRRMLDEFLAGTTDPAVHDRFWADDLIYTRAAGTRINKEELMKSVRSTPKAGPTDPATTYSAEDVRIQQYGDAAVVAFKLVGTTTRPDGTRSISNHLNTGTFIKRKGKWQAVAWQATAVPRPAAETPSSAAEPEIQPAAARLAPGTSAAQTAESPASRTYIWVLKAAAITKTWPGKRSMSLMICADDHGRSYIPQNKEKTLQYS